MIVNVIDPEPRLSRSPGSIGSCTQPEVGEHSVEILREMEYTEEVRKENIPSVLHIMFLLYIGSVWVVGVWCCGTEW